MSKKSPHGLGYPASGRNLTKIIYNLKLGQAIIILLILAILLYLLNYIGALPNIPPFLVLFSRPPFPALADASLTSAVVGFAFERLVRNESRAELSDLLNDHLREQREAYLALLPNALLLDVPVQRELIKEDKLDKVIQTALQSKFGDQMGEEVYHGLLLKATAYTEFRRYYRHEIFVRNITDINVSQGVQQEFFDVLTVIKYETTLQKSQFLFTCVDTQDQFNKLLQSTKYEDVWVSPPSSTLQASGQMAFELLEIFVDNIKLNIVSQQRNGHFEFVCEDPILEAKRGQNVTVRYKFKAKAEKIGHVIHTTVNYPTYDVTIEFDFGNSSIGYVDVLDYFVSSTSPSISPIPDEKKTSKYSVQLKEWVFPKGGVAFVWSLKEEYIILQQLLNNPSDQPGIKEEEDERAP